ncbi:MAG: ABC transporter ATP-binding protein [Desulfobacterales bacterium]|nr:ABC transporter ATP-binding protein [Desulfobacterales bacterium]
MQHDLGYFEEGQLDKPYDLRLLKRMLPFLAPYRLWLAFTVGIVVTLTLMDLALPYLTKTAIDRYIVPAAATPADGSPGANRILTVPVADPAVRAVVDNHIERFRIDGRIAQIAWRDLQHLPPEAIRTLRQKDLDGLLWITAAFLLLIALDFGFNFVQRLVMEYTGHRIMHDLRLKLFDRILDLSLTFFTRNPLGRLVTRATNDVQNMHELFTSVLSMLFKDLFLLAGIGAVLLVMDWRLALASFAVLPLVVAASLWFSRQVREVFRRQRVKIAEINTHFAETIGGIKILQAFRREQRNEKRFRRLNHENYQAGMDHIHILAVFMPLVEVLALVTVAIIIWYGGWRIVNADMTLGVLVAFISYLRMFFRPIRDLSEKYNILQNALASAERIFLIMDSPDRMPRPKAMPAPVGEELKRIETIEFHRVGFSYVPGEPVLTDVSFEVGAGQTVALVGATGSGKTTLTMLLLRFYLPEQGRILINGRDMTGVNPATLRARMALVTQEPFLFAGSVRANIFPDPDTVSEDRIQAILAAANCRAIVDRLPQGLDTPIGEGGGALSSGERQLFSIARAFAREAEVIILDEATSYIDSNTETRIQEALNRLTANRTTIVVAHRLSTVRQADRIIVMERGRIREAGTHQQLLQREGYYYRLHRCQA